MALRPLSPSILRPEAQRGIEYARNSVRRETLPRATENTTSEDAIGLTIIRNTTTVTATMHELRFTAASFSMALYCSYCRYSEPNANATSFILVAVTSARKLSMVATSPLDDDTFT
jgi:hypothetical protein